MSKYIELAKKIKALADQGIGGEKENAQEALNALMKKHGITMSEIEGEKKTLQYFPLSGQNRSLMTQVMSSVVLKPEIYATKDGKDLALDCTSAQFLEIKSKNDFYQKALKAQQDLLYSAFVQKNQIFHPDARTVTTDEMSKEELENAKKVIKMASTIELSGYAKTLKQ